MKPFVFCSFGQFQVGDDWAEKGIGERDVGGNRILKAGGA